MTGNSSVIMGDVLLKDSGLLELLQQNACKPVPRQGCMHLKKHILPNIHESMDVSRLIATPLKVTEIGDLVHHT